MGAAAEVLQTLGGGFGGFDFDVDGLRAVLNGQIEHGKLFFDAAVETAAVLVPAAGGEDDALRKTLEEAADGARAARRVIQKIEAEFEENFAGLGLPLRVFQQAANVGQA
jgi:hypothetical protein